MSKASFNESLARWSLSVGFALLHLVASANSGWSQTPSNLVQLAQAKELLVETERVAFPVSTTHGAVGGGRATPEVINSYARLLVTELGLYPKELFKRARLSRIVLCRDLSFAGQRRNAVPDFEHNTLYLEVERGAENPNYMRQVIHHDFYHMIDYRDDGQVYGDSHWATLNKGGFRYGAGGASVQNNSRTGVLTESYPGFLNHYSTTGVEEDKAEIYSHLVVNQAHVRSRAQRDSVLDAKIRRLQDSLKRFCPAMNDEFWTLTTKTRHGE